MAMAAICSHLQPFAIMIPAIAVTTINMAAFTILYHLKCVLYFSFILEFMYYWLPFPLCT